MASAVDLLFSLYQKLSVIERMEAAELILKEANMDNRIMYRATKKPTRQMLDQVEMTRDFLENFSFRKAPSRREPASPS
ncbi:hypothetical protein [Robiginitalea biformata]|uniref:Uncharacterized protein n=1 Tax=Robiginitalea biformata (strain ATCC BAA-864 / DSM 15991 / KCTC 12146 / HTCC2501) TaxID=313596 RepID=A4CKL2_ROBBH|nr:hypothetical protein [Robiginitalea biformata]EAR15411.1 hypothetical protein RB2501_13824 [Robiginitalea biformata HTCC2501]